ncbi:sigma-70 family RNA polymerase sigma factor [Streptomyces sp. NRRL S-350]|uniref:sigma-70 family RNA polymerase sigma factor n=1 Tax=Streptomyces sp. NRRL S-350 TaxID=1463902 RepID=UPI0004BF35E9|nr:sigma-70 family RNA polymerase sigma factor [Streptomyces sp. NRRL S-350]
MIDLTEQQIRDAQNNDLDAVTAMVKATEERVVQLARRYASTGGRVDPELVDDLAQVGRITVWEAISRFRGETVAEFFTFIDRTLCGAMSDERKTETRQGVSRQAAADFERALSLAGGDPYEAEFLATTTEAMGARRMSEDAAYAARLSYQGVRYLEAPLTTTGNVFPGEEAGGVRTIGEWLADRLAVPMDLLEPSDFERDRREQTRERVHATLDRMGEQQGHVLKALTGIDPVGYYGTEHDDELARDMGIPRARISVIRSKGKDRFRVLWEKAA